MPESFWAESEIPLTDLPTPPRIAARLEPARSEAEVPVAGDDCIFDFLKPAEPPGRLLNGEMAQTLTAQSRSRVTATSSASGPMPDMRGANRPVTSCFNADKSSSPRHGALSGQCIFLWPDSRPAGVFSATGAGVKTNLLFFTRGRPGPLGITTSPT